MDPDTEHCLSNSYLLYTSAYKTKAQLSLEILLQGTNHVSGSVQPRSALIPNTQARDAKPRLLLMGLRRYVFCLKRLGWRKINAVLGVESLPLPVWFFTKCLRMKPFSWNPPLGSKRTRSSKVPPRNSVELLLSLSQLLHGLPGLGFPRSVGISRTIL